MPIATLNTRVQSPPGSADPRGSANPPGHRPGHGPELGPSVANAEQGADRSPTSNTSPGVPLPGSEVSEIHQMLKELCDGQSQIKQWLNAVEDRSPRLQSHGTPTESELAPANNYPTRSSTHSGEPPWGEPHHDGVEWGPNGPIQLHMVNTMTIHPLVGGPMVPTLGIVVRRQVPDT